MCHVWHNKQQVNISNNQTKWQCTLTKTGKITTCLKTGTRNRKPLSPVQSSCKDLRNQNNNLYFQSWSVRVKGVIIMSCEPALYFPACLWMRSLPLFVECCVAFFYDRLSQFLLFCSVLSVSRWLQSFHRSLFVLNLCWILIWHLVSETTNRWNNIKSILGLCMQFETKLFLSKADSYH